MGRNFDWLVSTVEKALLDSRPADQQPCILWPFAKNRRGYGNVWDGKRTGNPHRIALQMKLGHHLPADCFVIHTCDTPSCFNPTHLVAGDHDMNMLDMKLKGRQPRRTLMPKQVTEIRRRSAMGEPASRLAAEYGVTKSAIKSACTGKTHLHVDGPVREPKGSPLTDDLVRVIKADLQAGRSVRELVEQYGVVAQTIRNITDDKAWTHVPWPEPGPHYRRLRRRLTADQVQQIQRMLADGVPQGEIASHFRVPTYTVLDIAKGKTWRQVTGINPPAQQTP